MGALVTHLGSATMASRCSGVKEATAFWYHVDATMEGTGGTTLRTLIKRSSREPTVVKIDHCSTSRLLLHTHGRVCTCVFVSGDGMSLERTEGGTGGRDSEEGEGGGEGLRNGDREELAHCRGGVGVDVGEGEGGR